MQISSGWFLYTKFYLSNNWDNGEVKEVSDLSYEMKTSKEVNEEMIYYRGKVNERKRGK